MTPLDAPDLPAVLAGVSPAEWDARSAHVQDCALLSGDPRAYLDALDRHNRYLQTVRT